MSWDHYFCPMLVRSSGRFCLTLQNLHMSLQHGKFHVEKMICPTIIIDHPTCGVHISHPIHTKISPQRFQLSRLNHFFQIVSDKGEQGSDDLDSCVFPKRCGVVDTGCQLQQMLEGIVVPGTKYHHPPGFPVLKYHIVCGLVRPLQRFDFKQKCFLKTQRVTIISMPTMYLINVPHEEFPVMSNFLMVLVIEWESGVSHLHFKVLVPHLSKFCNCS